MYFNGLDEWWSQPDREWEFDRIVEAYLMYPVIQWYWSLNIFNLGRNRFWNITLQLNNVGIEWLFIMRSIRE